MTAASPWSVKGIDPKAREVAKDLARRSGMTLGEWLNQMIIEGEADAPPPSSRYGETDYRDSAPRDYSPPGEPFRAPSPKAAELQRITRALDQLSQRMEAAEHRSTLAISGIDQSVMGVLSRIEAVERDQGAVAARFDGALDDVRQAQAKSADRVRRLSDDDAPRIEAMKALEAALGKVAEKLYEGETKTRAALNELREDASNVSRRMDRTEAKVESEPASILVDSVVARIAERLERAESKTSEAVRALEASFAGLDARLKAGEIDAEASERRFERQFSQLADELSDKVEAARTEMADRLRDAADGKLDKLESALRDLAGNVEQGERRSAQAIDRMGREVMRIASTLGERVGKVEARSADAVEQMGGDMARIADAIEQRMGRQDAVQAQALEKLGGEIGRIAEKLAERIAGAERRSAQSLDDVGDQLGRVTERLNQRSDRANAELADRIAQSEARTAKLLEEAQGKIDARLFEAQRRASLEAAAEAARKAAEAESAPEPAEPEDHGSDFAAPFGGTAAPDAFSLDPFAAPPAAASPAFAPELSPEPLKAPEATPFIASEPAASGGFGPEPFGALASATALAPEPRVQAAPLSNREMLEQARAAARSASERPDPRSRRSEAPVGAVETPPLDSDAKAFGFGLKKKKKDGVTIRTALVASGTAAAIAVTGVGAVLLVNSEMGGTTDHGASRFGIAPTAVAQETPPPTAPLAAAATDADVAAPPPPPAQMAVALTPPPGEIEGLKPAPVKSTAADTAMDSAIPAPKPVAGPAPATLYSAAVRKIESNDPTGLEDLKRAANLGHPAAQFYLAKLYETGGGGVKKDLAEARRWTERAALGGDTAAMHNLGLYYYEGEAGPQDSAKAALWFKKAADQGVKDSQYNLALLYAKGYGVAQNPAEAYKWYLIAAAAGDDGAKTAAQTIRLQLTPETQAAAERAAAAFHAQAQGAVRTASNP